MNIYVAQHIISEYENVIGLMWNGIIIKKIIFDYEKESWYINDDTLTNEEFHNIIDGFLLVDKWFPDFVCDVLDTDKFCWYHKDYPNRKIILQKEFAPLTSRQISLLNIVDDGPR